MTFKTQDRTRVSQHGSLFILKLRFILDILYICLGYTPTIQCIFFSSPNQSIFLNSLLNLLSALDFRDACLPIWSVILRLLPDLTFSTIYSSDRWKRRYSSPDNVYDLESDRLTESLVDVYCRIFASSAKNVQQTILTDLEVSFLRILVFFELCSASLNQRISECQKIS